MAIAGLFRVIKWLFTFALFDKNEKLKNFTSRSYNRAFSYGVSGMREYSTNKTSSLKKHSDYARFLVLWYLKATGPKVDSSSESVNFGIIIIRRLFRISKMPNFQFCRKNPEVFSFWVGEILDKFYFEN